MMKSSTLDHLYPAKQRSNHGCWTCRLRKKACSFDSRRAKALSNGQRPDCEICRRLEITCHSGDEKPEWMNTEAQRKEMMHKITAEIKDKASRRRDRKYLEMLEVGTSRVSLSNDEPRKTHEGPATARTAMSVSGSSDTDPPSSSHESGSTPPSSLHSHNSPQEHPFQSTTVGGRYGSDNADVDVHSIMIYLDYVFPFLYPYYRPPVLSGGRGWVLDILQNSTKSVYYTANSLASYFSGILLVNGDIQHASCTTAMFNRLQNQLEHGVHELQKEMGCIASGAPDTCLKDRVLVMASILTMVLFEVATGTNDNWRMHLDAAIAVFCQILPEPDLEQWVTVIRNLDSDRWPPPNIPVRRPWATHQAALRFFSSNLLYFDVMSSITLERLPRLYSYQDAIIPGCKSKPTGTDSLAPGPLFMDEFFGLNNGIVQMLADIAALASWKKEQRAAGTLSMNELVSRGQVVGEAIKVGMGYVGHIVTTPNSAEAANLKTLVEDPLAELLPKAPEDHPAYPLHNLIWLHAVEAYLQVVISGWQPSLPEIRWSVQTILSLLDNYPSGASCLRTMSFPFCIAGCLSPQEDEQKFRDILDRLGPLKVFGTMKDGMAVMEKVWSVRDQLDESWDIAKCLRILGHSVLLI